MRVALMTDAEIAEIPSMGQALAYLKEKKQRAKKGDSQEKSEPLLSDEITQVTEVKPEPPLALPEPPDVLH
jgi:hypothetical protein